MDDPRQQRTLGRRNLQDDGKRDWYEESVKYLDLHYPDWKDLQRTVMVPPAFPVSVQEASLGDITEKRVYDLLEEFGKAYRQPMFVVHSHQFAELIEEQVKGFEVKMKKWNKGEHDFVIIHRKYGFIFLQVKSIRCQDGKAFKDAKWQLDKDIKSIEAFIMISESFPALRQVLYNYPGFVVMPNCQPDSTKNPIDPTGVFKNDCEDKESFKQWWDDKVDTSNTRVMNEGLYEALLVRFVALRCSSPSTSSQIDETHKQIVDFHTPEQLECMLTAGAEQWWAGPAGSGKTVLLKKKVKELVRNSETKILVLCFNKPLSVHLEKNFEDWWLNQCNPELPFDHPFHVHTYDSFIRMVFTDILHQLDSPDLSLEEKFARRREEVENYFENNEPLCHHKYQHIFVDEAQDFHGQRWLNVLRKFHDQDSNDGNSTTTNTTNDSSSNSTSTANNNYSNSIRYFWVFFDSNQHVQLRENESIFWLSNPNVFRLTKVLRNTENIFLLAKTCYSGNDREQITLGHQEVGMNVVYDDNLKSDRSNGAKILNERVSELQKEKVKLRDIVILTRTKEDSSRLKKFSMPRRDAQHKDDPSDDFVIVDSIRRFKGLESKVVILYDPPYRLDENIVETSALLYTAISRCFCYLLIVSTVDGCKAIKQRVEEETDGRVDSRDDWD